MWMMILDDRIGGWQFLLVLCFICSFLVQEAVLVAAVLGFRLLQALVPCSNAHEKPQVIRALQYRPALEKVSRIIKNGESSTVWTGIVQELVCFPGIEGLQFPVETRKEKTLLIVSQRARARESRRGWELGQMEGLNVKGKESYPLGWEVRKASSLNFNSQGSIGWNWPIQWIY